VPESTPPTSKRRRVLVAEDEADLRQVLRLSLGQRYDVETTEDGLAAVRAFEALRPDLMILDIMMPRMDGFQVCEYIRRSSEVPIIMLTALSGVDDMVTGFNLGADDYIAKPFTIKELVARVEAVFRRIDWMIQAPVPSVIVNGEMRIDIDTHQIWCDGREMHLTPIEFQLLHYLAARPGLIISKAELFQEVWGYMLAGGTNLVEVGIRRLREKIERDPSNPQLILTARGAGYRFRVPPVADQS
jgi:DNA-binding response OmpR family regulator